MKCQSTRNSTEPMEHTFNDLDICMTGLTTKITFEMNGDNMVAIQTIKDADGNETTVANTAD